MSEGHCTFIRLSVCLSVSRMDGCIGVRYGMDVFSGKEGGEPGDGPDTLPDTISSVSSLVGEREGGSR